MNLNHNYPRPPRISPSLLTLFRLLLVVAAVCLAQTCSRAGDLVVEITNGSAVTFVGAINRWDEDGNHRVPVDPKAKIQSPAVTASAAKLDSGVWQFKGLPKGRYDLVILASDRIRVEGFHYPPVQEFDPFLLHGKQPPEDDLAWITKDIANAKHYENKVSPLFFVGDDKQVRVLVQLLRDKATSFDGQFGEPVATMRHEVWQYTNRYGGWAKEKRTKVFDRVLTGKSELRTWTWIWEPRLGGIEVSGETKSTKYEMPTRFDSKVAQGLLPY